MEQTPNRMDFLLEEYENAPTRKMRRHQARQIKQARKLAEKAARAEAQAGQTLICDRPLFEGFLYTSASARLPNPRINAIVDRGTFYALAVFAWTLQYAGANADGIEGLVRAVLLEMICVWCVYLLARAAHRCQRDGSLRPLWVLAAQCFGMSLGGYLGELGYKALAKLWAGGGPMTHTIIALSVFAAVWVVMGVGFHLWRRAHGR